EADVVGPFGEILERALIKVSGSLRRPGPDLGRQASFRPFRGLEHHHEAAPRSRRGFADAHAGRGATARRAGGRTGLAAGCDAANGARQAVALVSGTGPRCWFDRTWFTPKTSLASSRRPRKALRAGSATWSRMAGAATSGAGRATWRTARRCS